MTARANNIIHARRTATFRASVVGTMTALSLCVATGCESKRPAPKAIDAGAPPHATSVTRDDAVRVVQKFLAALQSADRPLLTETIAVSRLADALRPPSPPLGPERRPAFRDALLAEISRDDWRGLYQGASVARVETGTTPNPVVVIALDGGPERRAEIAADNGQPRIVRVY